MRIFIEMTLKTVWLKLIAVTTATICVIERFICWLKNGKKKFKKGGFEK